MKNVGICPGIPFQLSVGRAGNSKEIGKTAAFAPSGDASYVTGQTFCADIGWTGGQGLR